MSLLPLSAMLTLYFQFSKFLPLKITVLTPPSLESGDGSIFALLGVGSLGSYPGPITC